MKIGNKILKKESMELYLIAEIGVNFYDIAEKENIEPIEGAKLMIKKAAQSGADAVKFQLYKANKLASKYSPAYWDTTKEKSKTQYELFKKYDKLSYDEFQELYDYCRKMNIDFLATPFDFEAVDTLDKWVPAFKVASADITDKPLLQYIAKKNKPILLSTGASYVDEIYRAIRWIKEISDVDIAILHCVLSYPTQPLHANLGSIPYLSKHFPDNIIGYSDHVPPDKNMNILTYAYLLGARIIEKHFTLDKTLPGNDHYHAMDVHDLEIFISNIRSIQKVYGSYIKTVLECEKISRREARRSIVVNLDLPKGSIITKKDISIKRPGTGIPPYFIDEIIGKRTTRDLKKDEILKWGFLE